MKKKIVGVIALLLSLTCFSSCLVEDNSGQTNDGDSYYKLDYYDELNEEIGYNTSLFYQNNHTAIGPDPSVIYGKGEDGKDYFYVYPTGNQHSIYAYRSTDMSNWKGVGLVFKPETNSWAQSAMWAPDVIYDPEADDGQGGKGLYYLFFTASDSVRNANKQLYFENREERETYMSIKDEVFALDDTAAIEKLLKVNALCTEYGVENVEQVDYALSLYEANKKEVEARTDISTAEKQRQIGELAKDTILSIRTADMHTLNAGGDLYAGMLATSKTLDGPFVQYTNDGEDGNREISIREPFLTHEDLYEVLSEKYVIDSGLNIVDMHPFVDPETGDKYMYFNSNALAPHTIFSVAEIYVVKVGDKDSRWTDDWQWDTVKQLTRTGYVDMGENENPKATDQSSDLGESDINEGPYVIYNEENGKYYLTLSKGRWKSKGYAVLQAVSDSPMGPFKKFSEAEGGILLQSETNWTHVTGPGHHSLIEYNGKTYIVYHTHINADASGDRAIAMDEVKWIKNQNGDWIMYCNGATKSPQFKLDSGYENIVNKATVSVNNGSGENKASLTDGLISATSKLAFVKEFTAKKGVTTITLDFGVYRTVRGLMVYNSREYEKAFKGIRRIEFDFTGEKDGQTVKGTAYIDNLKFNEKYFYELYGSTYILPGSAAIAEFEEMHVKTIRITFDVQTPINVSEIVVIGQ